jgi:group I intron endonuclease
LHLLAHVSSLTMWIYKLTNTINGKVYVGKTVDLKARLYMHSRAYDGKTAIHRAIKKHGFATFAVDVLEAGVATEEELRALEIQWIATLGATDRARGYNLTAGGEGMRGYVPSAETRALWSSLRKGKPPSDACREAGRVVASRPKSADTRMRMSAAAHLRASRPGYKESLSASLKGIPKTEAHKEALKRSARARPAARVIEHEGVSRNLCDWAIFAGISSALLRYRLENGWPMDRALTPAVGNGRFT